MRSRIDAVSGRNCTVLICGESGAGKELVARHIHAASPRAAGPFITVDCTTLRDTLFESQLFGHVKGAFTGADHSTLGLFRAASGGTLFLDEVGELELHIQSKLLRCIEENAVLPLGAVEPIPVDVRIIAATHRDLREMARRGTFREDLYFRLDVVRLDVPPVRARRNDIIPLAEQFVAAHAALYEEPVKMLSPHVKAALRSHAWPGNVRELRNVIEHALAFANGECVTAADLPEVLRHAAPNHQPEGRSTNGRRKNGQTTGTRRRVVPLKVAERCLVKRALRATRGNQTRAAELLGVERHRLARLIRRHGLTASVWSQSS
ncbi:MAG: sigma 54-interacting transcriptional regulator [Gemmatimonadota bacterium]|nr:MAG: sigma 54-interacting transcriptional regulator [Gemmatimonadota bacterium]